MILMTILSLAIFIYFERWRWSIEDLAWPPLAFSTATVVATFILLCRINRDGKISALRTAAMGSVVGVAAVFIFSALQLGQLISQHSLATLSDGEEWWGWDLGIPFLSVPAIAIGGAIGGAFGLLSRRRAKT
jgi:hypothetical protein